MERWRPKGKPDCCYQKGAGWVRSSCPQQFYPYLGVSTILVPDTWSLGFHLSLEKFSPWGCQAGASQHLAGTRTHLSLCRNETKDAGEECPLGGRKPPCHKEPVVLSGYHDVISLFCVCKKCGLNTACLTTGTGLKDSPN